MVSFEDIQAYADRVAAQYHPEKIILFGSYAYGTPNPDSDVDLLVIMHFEGKWVHQAVDIQMKVRSTFALDLLVKTPETVQERLAGGDSFIERILGHGKVLYQN